MVVRLRQIAAEVLGSGNYSYLWSTGATGPGVTVTSTGNYDVELRDQATGCDTTTAAFVDVFAPLSVTIAVDQVACDDNNEIILTAFRCRHSRHLQLVFNMAHRWVLPLRIGNNRSRAIPCRYRYRSLRRI